MAAYISKLYAPLSLNDLVKVGKEEHPDILESLRGRVKDTKQLLLHMIGDDGLTGDPTFDADIRSRFDSKLSLLKPDEPDFQKRLVLGVGLGCITGSFSSSEKILVSSTFFH
jgi:hypothetical protein